MKMLYGLYPSDGGEVASEGAVTPLYPPSKANALGVRMVFQDFRLVPALTVAENMALAVGRGAFKLGLSLGDESYMSEQYGLMLSLMPMSGGLICQRQRVEIVKALPGRRSRAANFR